jgi:DNA-binding MarR family transcriptional regulator
VSPTAYETAELEAEGKTLAALRARGPMNLALLRELTGLSQWRARGALQRLSGRGLVERRRTSKAEGDGRSFLIWRAVGPWRTS